MKDIFSVDCRDVIRKVVRRELKDKFGMKTSKDKDKDKCIDETQNVFGVPLEKVASKNVNTDEYNSVPIFLYDSFEFLRKHLTVEGLFRKSGSVGRQKMLREIAEKEGTCCSCDFAQAHDIASLVKQFFRELPDPLLTTRLSQAFINCNMLTEQNDSISALALCCILLPDEHLRVLRYFVQFINDVANHSSESKMTLNNLAIVFSPNLMNMNGKDKNSEKSMKEITHVVLTLFKNSHLIGMVPDILWDKAMNLNTEEGGFYSSSGDELEEEVIGRMGRTLARSDKKRDRSKSITNFLKRNFKPGDNKGTPKHSRTKSEKLSPSSQRLSFRKRNSVTDIGHSDAESVDGNARRRNSQQSSPVRKSPRLKKEQVCPVISKPMFQSMSNQVALTPRKHLKPIQVQPTRSCDSKSRARKLPTLPSKFELSRANPEKRVSSSKVNLSRSKSTYVGKTSTSSVTTNVSLDDSAMSQIQYRELGEGKPLQGAKVSRNTQKPHVRKSRRASSLDRRRARYASQREPRRLPKTPPKVVITAESRKSVENKTIGANAAFIDFDDTIPAAPISNSIVTTTTTTSSGTVTKPVSRKKSASERTAERKPSAVNRRKLPGSTQHASFRSENPALDKNAVTPPNKCNIKRSATTISSSRVPTPYNVTPHISVRKKRPVIGNV